MVEQFLKEDYIKIKLLKKTQQKQIWLVKNILDCQLCVAKVQHSVTTEVKGQYTRTVLHEGKFMQVTQGYFGIPFLYWAGKDTNLGVSLMIVQKLEDTLEDKFLDIGSFSLKTVCQLGIQMFKIIRHFHEKGLVHGNIKLNSFQFGSGANSHNLFFNDLTYSRSLNRKGKSSKKEVCKNKLPFSQFMAFDRMIGYECYKKDDLQSIVLLLIYLLKGKLPWSATVQKINDLHNQSDIECDQPSPQEICLNKERATADTIKFNNRKERIQNLEQQKEQLIHNLLSKIDEMSLEQICQGAPAELRRLLAQCRQMDIWDTPDYNYFIRNLEKVMARNTLQSDQIFEWDRMKCKKLTVPSNTLKSLKFQLPNEQEMLSRCYVPYSQKIDLE